MCSDIERCGNFVLSEICVYIYIYIYIYIISCLIWGFSGVFLNVDVF